MVVQLRYLVTVLLCIASGLLYAQSFQFAHITDTHVGGATGAEDLRRTVADVNSLKDIDFLILSGDVTEFGSDAEFHLAKQILDSLTAPYFVIPGNHDANWSESGGNSFRKIFGSETFAFEHKGYLFVGTNSGPNMRMGPGQVPRENLVWMDSLFDSKANGRMPVIYINHYPQDSSLNNWYEVIDRLKQQNIQLILLGHGHVNKIFDFEGIPGVMSRSNLRADDTVGGYNIVKIHDGKVTYTTRRPGNKMFSPWVEILLEDHHFDRKNQHWPRPDYSVNNDQDQVEALWEFNDDSDLGTGFSIHESSLITANTAGRIYSLSMKSGERIWEFNTGGKIYSTPAVWDDYVVVGSSDGKIYALSARNGNLVWELETQGPVLGSPIVEEGIAYIGGSDGCFRAIDIRTGREIWNFQNVQGFVSSTPLFYNNTIYFGCWGNMFYALSATDGSVLWQWSAGYSNRMLSPAAVVPVQANNRIFIVAPDRYMTALNANNGAVIWREKKNPFRVRESIGLSSAKDLIYVKTMDGELIGVSTSSSEMHIKWKSDLKLPYELAPSAIRSDHRLVFVPSDKGVISAVDSKSGTLKWQYKISNALLNPVTLLGDNRVVVSSMDGKVVCLKYR